MKILHIIIGLRKGGAEGNLYQLLTRSSIPKNEITVISLTERGYYSDLLEEKGFRVHHFNLTKRPLTTFLKTVSLCKSHNIISCWMYHANMFGYLAVRHFGKQKDKKLIWNIRNGSLNPNYDSKLTILINKWCAKRSDKVDCIVYNGSNAKKAHEKNGYCDLHSLVVDNGCDCELFKPRPEIKSVYQKKIFGFDNSLPVILSVGRYHPIKDHKRFLSALGIVKKDIKFRAVLCGSGLNKDNTEISDMCRENGLIIDEDVFLLDQRDDVNYINDCCDLYVLHSASEAFPNTLVQAMASGCPFVATDAGEARKIAGDDFSIVETENHKQLAEKIIEMLKMDKSELEAVGERNRMRIFEKYNIEKVISQYEDLYI